MAAFPDALDAALAALPDVDAVLDCELVVVDDARCGQTPLPAGVTVGRAAGRGLTTYRR